MDTVKIKGFAKVPHIEGATYKNYRKFVEEYESRISQVLREHPVSAAIDIDNDFKELKKDGIYMGPTTAGSGRHAILIVGEGYEAEKNLHYWEILNSHGEDWCDNRYGRICKASSLGGRPEFMDRVSYPIP